MARICSACGKKIGAFSEWQSTKNGCICMSCYQRIIPFRKDVALMTDEQANSALHVIELNDAAVSNFEETDHIGQKFSYVAFFDDKSRTLLLPQNVVPAFEDQHFWAFSYDDIISAELLQNEKKVSTNGLAMALVGGALLGGVGAIAGMASAQDSRANAGSDVIDVRVKVRHYTSPTFTVNVSQGGFSESDPNGTVLVSHAVELVNRLNNIAGYVDDQEMQDESVTDEGPVSDILRFKKLLDEGVISEEEFAALKKQLLGL